MPSSGLGAYQVKIHQIIFGGVFFVLTLAAVRGMMFGGTANVKMMAAGSIAFAAILALDNYFWVALPALYFGAFKIPGLSFSPEEAGSLALIGVYFVRQAMHKEPPIKLTRKVLIAFPVFIWICLVWILNPTGMAMLGSSSIGARFYFQIALGFVTLLVLSAFHFTERDCKILFFVALSASLFSFLQSIAQFQANVIANDMSLDESSSRYYLLGALTLFTLVLSRYSLRQILGSPWKLPLVLFLAALSVYTGKRRAFGTVLVLPLLSVFFTGKEKMTVALFTVLGVVLVGFSVAGDGVLWELPDSAKRSLSIFVPAYETPGAVGMSDIFREGVRRYGKEVIRNNPWVGRKGFAMDRNETAWIAFSGSGDAFAGHAYVGNWHSTWYAFACDFGLPAMVMWAFFLVFALYWTFSGFRCRGFGEYSRASYFYFAYSLFISVIFSYTSGHSAYTSYGTWMIWGMLVAIQNGVIDRGRNPLEAGQ